MELERLERDGRGSGSHFPEFEVVLRRHAERISHTIEERKHRDDVHRFRYLSFRPALVTQFLHVVSGRAWSAFGDEFGVVHQSALGRSQLGFVELAFQNRRYASIIRSLNTQEVSVAV
jgi:hypothetical protein